MTEGVCDTYTAIVIYVSQIDVYCWEHDKRAKRFVILLPFIGGRVIVATAPLCPFIKV